MEYESTNYNLFFNAHVRGYMDKGNRRVVLEIGWCKRQVSSNFDIRPLDADRILVLCCRRGCRRCCRLRLNWCLLTYPAGRNLSSICVIYLKFENDHYIN